MMNTAHFQNEQGQQSEQQQLVFKDREKLLEEIKQLKQTIAQKDLALNQWMRMCEDLSQNLLQKQIDLKQMEISQNQEYDDESRTDSIHESSYDQKSDSKRVNNTQQLFYQNENNQKCVSNSNENDRGDTSRYIGVESTANGSCQTLNINNKDFNSTCQQFSPSKESKKIEFSMDRKYNENQYSFPQSCKTEQGNSSNYKRNNIDEQYIKEIEQVENEAINLLNEFKKQIGFENINAEMQLNNQKLRLSDDENDVLSECARLKQCIEDMKQEKEALNTQNNQFFRIINEKCLEIQHLQSLLIQRDQNVIDYSEKRNEEYKQFLRANNTLVNENKEQREMIFRFQQQLALLNYLKAENQEINKLKLEKQNLLVDKERLQTEVKNLKIIIQEQSEYKLQYNELKADYEILANHIQDLGEEYIVNSTANNTCPTCFTQDQYRLIIAQLQQKYSHLEKKYKHDVVNLMEDINVLKLALEKEKDQ